MRRVAVRSSAFPLTARAWAQSRRVSSFYRDRFMPIDKPLRRNKGKKRCDCLCGVCMCRVLKWLRCLLGVACFGCCTCAEQKRSEEHTSELQSLMRISYAVFCLKKKKKK